MNEVAVYMMNTVAQIKHYNWGNKNDFAVKQSIDAYEQSIEYIRNLKLDFFDMTEMELKEYGFQKWSKDSEIMMIPIYAYDLIEDGMVLNGVFGGMATKGTDYIDLDVRGGCIAFGIYPRK